MSRRVASPSAPKMRSWLTTICIIQPYGCRSRLSSGAPEIRANRGEGGGAWRVGRWGGWMGERAGGGGGGGAGGVGGGGGLWVGGGGGGGAALGGGARDCGGTYSVAAASTIGMAACARPDLHRASLVGAPVQGRRANMPS